MKVNELYQLAEWYWNDILPLDLSGHFDVASVRINDSLKRGAIKSQLADVYHVLSEDLCLAIKEVNIDSLSIDDINVLKKMGLENIILSPALNSIMSLLNVENDIHTISARIVDKHHKLLEAEKNFGQILEMIPVMTNVSDEKETYNPEKVLTRVTFHNEASINNVVDLSDWADSLSKIARGYSMMVGQAPEDFEVVSASKGSIIIDLLLNYEVVNMVGETVNHLADFVESCAEITLAIKSLKHLKRVDADLHKKSTEALQAELDKRQDKIADDVAEILHEKFAIDKENKEPKQVVKNSVKELRKLLDKGGDVEFLGASDEVTKNEQIEYVNEALLKLKERSTQRAIEDKTED